MMKKMTLTACFMMLMALGIQAQTAASSKVTPAVLSYDYFCNSGGSNGSLSFWLAGDQLVVEENWGSEDGYDGGTAYLCEVNDGQLRAVKSCEVEMAQWDGIVSEQGYAEWKDVKDYFQPITPFYIKYNPTAKTLTVKRNVFKRDEKNEQPIDFSKVKGFAAQPTAKAAGDSSGDGYYDTVETMPEFPGGQDALYQYMAKNMKYPIECQENAIQGKVVVQFIVKKDGSVGDVTVIRSVHPQLDAEAVRLAENMPKWKPGIQKGKPVPVRFQIPVTFRLGN